MDDTGATDVDAMLEMYGFLRNEITQSNRLQQQLVLGLATFVGLVFGLVFSGALADFGTQSSASYQLVIAAVLPITSVTAGIWLAEQSRVMMAGNYLQLLEHKINDRIGNAPMSWENWLRRDTSLTNQKTYDVAYLIGYVCFFLVIGVLSGLLYIYEVVMGTIALNSISFIGFLKILWLLIWSGVLMIISLHSYRVLGHKTENMSGKVLTRWEQKEFQSEVLLSEAFDAYPDLVENIEFEASSTEEQFRELLERADN